MSALDDKIKKASEFMQLWDNYHSRYQTCLNKRQATSEDERPFSQIRELAARAWQEVEDTLAGEPGFGVEAKSLIRRILSVDSLFSLSDSQLERLNADWGASYNILNTLLADMQKARAGQAKSQGGRLWPLRKKTSLTG